jgi:hypothetical protein
MVRRRHDRAAMVADPAVLGVSRLNWRSAGPAVFQGVKEALAGDFTDEGVSRLLNMLEPDETAGAARPVRRRGRPPHSGQSDRRPKRRGTSCRPVRPA